MSRTCQPGWPQDPKPVLWSQAGVLGTGEVDTTYSPTAMCWLVAWLSECGVDADNWDGDT